LPERGRPARGRPRLTRWRPRRARADGRSGSPRREGSGTRTRVTSGCSRTRSCRARQAAPRLPVHAADLVAGR
jgi:hypothetical protein